MKKVGRLSLLNLTDKCNLIDENTQKCLIGGGSGTPDDPFTEEEYNYLFYSGQWQGGCVEGMGWVTPDVYIYAEKPGGYGGYTKPGSGGSGGSGGSLWPGWPGGGSAGSYPGHNNYYPNHNDYPGHNNYSKPYSYYGYYGYHSSGGGGGASGSGDHGHDDTTTESYRIIKEILMDALYSGTNEQRWNAMEYAYRNILSDIGVNIFGIDFYFSDERYARAWKVNTFGRDIAIGANFFDLSVEDSIAVLVHECMHVNYDGDVLSTNMKEVSIDYYDSVPDNFKEYINNTYYEGKASDIELRAYFTVNSLAELTHYENEINAYMKEKELCPNVSLAYEEERNFRIWYYQKMAEFSKEYDF